MRKKKLLARINQLEKALSLKQDRITEWSAECKRVHTFAHDLVKQSDSDWEEICKLKDKIYKLQAEKEGLIECVKQKRYIISCDENEIKRLNDIIEVLNDNIEAQNTTVAQNDIAYYKMLETNAFLAGKLKVYEKIENKK